jgi:hypothetical protein
MFAVPRFRAAAVGMAIGFISAAGASQPALAVTITFGSSAGNFSPYVEGNFTFDIARIVSDNKCSGAPCMGLNTNETSILTRVGGGLFTLDSFSFVLVGNPPELTIIGFLNATPTATYSFDTGSFSKNDEHVFSTAITNITSLVFTDTGTGNVRVDSINVHAVPGPIAGAGLPA